MKEEIEEIYSAMHDEIRRLETQVIELEKTIVYAKDVLAYHVDEELLMEAFDDSEANEITPTRSPW